MKQVDFRKKVATVLEMAITIVSFEVPKNIIYNVISLSISE